MIRTTTSRPRMAAIYAPGTVRARRWHGDGDVRGYRPPSGWTARADLTDMHPITGRFAACRVVGHRDEGMTPAPTSARSALGPVDAEIRARRWPRPVMKTSSQTRTPPPSLWLRRRHGRHRCRARCLGARAYKASAMKHPRVPGLSQAQG